MNKNEPTAFGDWQCNGGGEWHWHPASVVNHTACDECSGTGFSVQGWTDKNGEPEDQYGPCGCTRADQHIAAARAAVTAARAHPHHTNQTEEAPDARA